MRRRSSSHPNADSKSLSLSRFLIFEMYKAFSRVFCKQQLLVQIFRDTAVGLSEINLVGLWGKLKIFPSKAFCIEEDTHFNRHRNNAIAEWSHNFITISVNIYGRSRECLGYSTESTVLEIEQRLKFPSFHLLFTSIGQIYTACGQYRQCEVTPTPSQYVASALLWSCFKLRLPLHRVSQLQGQHLTSQLLQPYREWRQYWLAFCSKSYCLTPTRVRALISCKTGQIERVLINSSLHVDCPITCCL